MLTDEDVKKLVGLLATKDDVAEIKHDLEGLREAVQALIISMDGVLRRMEILNTEFLSLTNKVNRHEEWIKLVAEKTGTKLTA